MIWKSRLVLTIDETSTTRTNERIKAMNLFQKISQAIFKKKTIIKKTKYTRSTKPNQPKSTRPVEKKPRKSKYSIDFKEKIVKEVLAGCRQHILARKYGIAQSTIAHWMMDHRLRIKTEEKQVKNANDLQSFLKDMSLEDVCEFMNDGEPLSYFQKFKAKETEYDSTLILNHPEYGLLEINFKADKFVDMYLIKKTPTLG